LSAVAAALLHKPMAAKNLEPVSTLQFNSLIKKNLKVLTFSSSASLAPSQNVSQHMTKLLSSNTGNFSLKIVFQSLQKVWID